MLCEMCYVSYVMSSYSVWFVAWAQLEWAVDWVATVDESGPHDASGRRIRLRGVEPVVSGACSLQRQRAVREPL